LARVPRSHREGHPPRKGVSVPCGGSTESRLIVMRYVTQARESKFLTELGARFGMTRIRGYS
jgi:hypothetical protein